MAAFAFFPLVFSLQGEVCLPMVEALRFDFDYLCITAFVLCVASAAGLVFKTAVVTRTCPNIGSHRLVALQT